MNLMAQHLQQAIQHFQQGDLVNALALAETIVESHPQSADALHLIALCKKGLNDFDGANNAFTHALSLQPENSQILTNHANLYLQIGNNESALKAYQKSLEVDPKHVAGWMGKAIATQNLGNGAGAEQAYRQALKLQPHSSNIWQGLGAALRHQNKYHAAKSAFKKAVEIDPQNGPAWINLGVVLRLLGRPQDALPCFDHAEQAGFIGPELTDARAGTLLDLARTDESIRHFQTLTQAHPNYVPAHEALAKIRWEHAPESQPLVALRQSALAQPNNMPLQMVLIQMLLDQQKWEDVLEHHAHIAHGLSPASSALIQARAHDGLNEHHKARSFFDIGVKELPHDANMRIAYARHLLRTHQADQAALHVEQAIAINPDDQMAWAYQGTIWRLLGDEREHWLHDYDSLVSPIEVDIPDEFESRDAFAAAIEAALLPMHIVKKAPIDQSLREGTQTSGHLFGYAEGAVALARDSIHRAISGFISQLDDDHSHPFLKRKSDAFHFTGSWSVRLRSAGHHINHVHGKGWISSAFYVALPPAVSNNDPDKQGWIQFGQPPLDLGLGLEPRRYIKPRVGTLALFPSYTWHGTVPFDDEAHRMTMAFDTIPTL